MAPTFASGDAGFLVLFARLICPCYTWLWDFLLLRLDFDFVYLPFQSSIFMALSFATGDARFLVSFLAFWAAAPTGDKVL